MQSSLFLREGLGWDGGLGLPDQAKLTGQDVLGIHLSLPAQCWDYQYLLACLDFLVGSRMELMFPWVYNKHFTNCAVSPAPAVTLDLGNLASKETVLAQGGEVFICTYWSRRSSACTARQLHRASFLTEWRVSRRQSGWCYDAFRNLSSGRLSPFPQRMASHRSPEYMHTWGPDPWGLPV